VKLNKYPEWLEVDEAYLSLIDREIYDLTPWEILLNDEYVAFFKSLKKNYPERELVPFFRRQDNDDVACWERGRGSGVVIIHNFASPGWETEATYKSFWDWFRSSIEDMIDWGRDN